MKTIQRMIDRHGGFEAVQRNYLSIENPPYMRLVIEVIGGPYPNGTHEVSVAHYGEQNGDAMRDPEMTFLVLVGSDDSATWTPLTYENSYMSAYQVAAEVTESGQVRVLRPRLMRQLRGFANQWDRNIAEQGFLEAQS